MTGRRRLCGWKGGQKVATDFCIHPDLAVKKMRLIFSGKGGPDAALRKIIQKQKSTKHYDDLNRAMRTKDKNCAQMKCKFLL